MATTKPRITVTLTQRQHDVLRVISECGGQSMSAFISELLEQSLPVLERMAQSFRKIKAAQDEQKKRIADELDQAQAEVEPVLEQVLGQFDLFMTRIEQTATSAATTPRGEGVPALGVLPTPVTNRGVTPTQVKGRKASPGKASGVSHAKSFSKKLQG
jgi:uncharacterized protein (DUF1778 family)